VEEIYTTFIIEVKVGHGKSTRWTEIARKSEKDAFQKLSALFEHLNRPARLIEVLDEV
jgi:hypothetical protein